MARARVVVTLHPLTDEAVIKLLAQDGLEPKVSPYGINITRVVNLAEYHAQSPMEAAMNLLDDIEDALYKTGLIRPEFTVTVKRERMED